MSSHHAEGVRDEGFDDLLDAIERGEGYSLECANGHGSFPPRQVCPHCGSRELTERPLPEAGQVVTYTTVAIPTPQFADDAPYTTAVVDFAGAHLTGIVDAPPEEIEVGTTVGVDVTETATRGERMVRFTPR